jgi:hypothetical protein
MKSREKNDANILLQQKEEFDKAKAKERYKNYEMKLTAEFAESR